MRVLKICFSVLAISLMTMFFAPSLNAQESLKSNTVTEYNGKKFYIHTVKKKQSLNDIAEIYGVTVFDILSENKDLKKTNPKAGTIIRIPYKEFFVQVDAKVENADIQIIAIGMSKICPRYVQDMSKTIINSKTDNLQNHLTR